MVDGAAERNDADAIADVRPSESVAVGQVIPETWHWVHDRGLHGALLSPWKNENDVVDAMVAHLKSQGWTIE
jgi:hypothetical protein